MLHSKLEHAETSATENEVQSFIDEQKNKNNHKNETNRNKMSHAKANLP